jgi:hypothetical protein
LLLFALILIPFIGMFFIFTHNSHKLDKNPKISIIFKYFSKIQKIKMHTLFFGITMVILISFFKYVFILHFSDFFANICIATICVGLRVLLIELVENIFNLYEINISLGQIFWGKAYLGGEDINIITRKNIEYKPSNVSLMVNANSEEAQSTESNSNQQRYNLRSGDRQASNSPRINIGTLPPGDIQDYNYPASVNPWRMNTIITRNLHIDLPVSTTPPTTGLPINNITTGLPINNINSFVENNDPLSTLPLPVNIFNPATNNGHIFPHFPGLPSNPFNPVLAHANSLPIIPGLPFNPPAANVNPLPDLPAHLVGLSNNPFNTRTGLLEGSHHRSTPVPLSIPNTAPGECLSLDEHPQGVVLLTTVRSADGLITERYTDRIRIIYTNGNSVEFLPNGKRIHKNSEGRISKW